MAVSNSSFWQNSLKLVHGTLRVASASFITHLRYKVYHVPILLFPILVSAKNKMPEYISATVLSLPDNYTLIAESNSNQWKIRQEYPIFSHDQNPEVISYVHLNDIEKQDSGNFKLIFKITRNLKNQFVAPGDTVALVDLKSVSEIYEGNTDLIIHDRPEISARYKPLVYQGIQIGETAQTLAKDEQLAYFAGYYQYGLNNYWSLGTWVTGFLSDNYNLSSKLRIYNDDGQTVSIGLSGAHNNLEKTGSVSLAFYWDSVSSRRQISHTVLQLGLSSWKLSEEKPAIRIFGTNSLQSGYEIVMDDWNRLLFGPIYNFEIKAVGGYVAYMWIWDTYHFSLSLNTHDISKYEIDAEKAYYGLFEMLWRW